MTSGGLSDLAPAPCFAWLHNWHDSCVDPVLERDRHGDACATFKKRSACRWYRPRALLYRLNALLVETSVHCCLSAKSLSQVSKCVSTECTSGRFAILCVSSRICCSLGPWTRARPLLLGCEALPLFRHVPREQTVRTPPIYRNHSAAADAAPAEQGC